MTVAKYAAAGASQMAEVASNSSRFLIGMLWLPGTRAHIGTYDPSVSFSNLHPTVGRAARQRVIPGVEIV
jgi:hypothetical protein